MAKIITRKYRCCECGHVFEEDELVAVEEEMGEFWGRPCTQTWYYSPCCKDDYEEYEDPKDEEDY